MTRYRNALPQLGGDLFLTDGGIETTLIFHEGLELPHIAAFHLLKTTEGRAALRKYFCTYAELANRFSAGLILESPTWRSNPDWGARLGYTADDLAEANRGPLYGTIGGPVTSGIGQRLDIEAETFGIAGAQDHVGSAGVDQEPDLDAIDKGLDHEMAVGADADTDGAARNLDPFVGNQFRHQPVLNGA